jgi:hypothetical protein
MSLRLVPVSLSQANAFIEQHHRHHRAVQGWKFGVGVREGDTIVGIAVAGRPVARMLDDGFTLEVTRCCSDGTPNVCSMLYGALRRAAKALGYRRLITYTLAEEPGTTLKASGWRCAGVTGGGSWNCASRPRTDKAPTTPKVRWEVPL